MDTQIDMAQPPVVVASYAKATHPKPHKKMIIDKYIPTIEAAQKVADEVLIMHVEKEPVKQYKGKRDPSSVPSRPITQPFLSALPSTDAQQKHHKELHIIDLSKSSTNHTPGSTKTVCSDGAIELSTCHTEDTDTDSQSGSNAPWDQVKSDRQRHLVRSAIEAFERNNPCMTTVDRVMSWRVAEELDEVEEFCSESTGEMEPFRTYLENYDAVDRHIQSTLSGQKHYSTAAVCNESLTLLRVDYTKKLNGNSTPNHRTNEPFALLHHTSGLPTRPANDRVDDPPIDIDNSHSDAIDTKVDGSPKKQTAQRVSSMLVEGEDGSGDHSGSSESQKEELYKYLGIDTNPMHARDVAATKESNHEDLDAKCKRRSLRVKVQQIAIHNLAKYHREKESIERERRTEDSCPLKVESTQSPHKTLSAGEKTKPSNGVIGSEEHSKHQRHLLSIATTPKDRRLAAAGGVRTVSSSATSSSQNSSKFSERNGAVGHFAQKKPVINHRGRGRPRKLVEPFVKHPKDNDQVETSLQTKTFHRRSDSHVENVALPLTKRRHSDQIVLSDKIVLNIDDEPNPIHNASTSMLSTSSASPYPQTMSSNELVRPQSDKNFTSDERTSNKSSPFILNRSNLSHPPPAKKASLLERRDYTKSAQPSPHTKSSIKSPPIIHSAAYSTKVLMENRKLTEAAAAVVPTFDPTSPPPPISERLQLRQLQRLAELENSPQQLKPPRTSAKPKTVNSRRQVLKVILQKQSKKVAKPDRDPKPTSDTPAPLPETINECVPDNRLHNNVADRVSPVEQQLKAITQLTELGVSLPTTTAAPIRQRRPAVSPRKRRLTNLRLRSHRPSRSVSVHRPAGLANGVTLNGKRLPTRIMRPANILKRRGPVDVDSAATAMEEDKRIDQIDMRIDDSTKRAPSSTGSVFLGFDMTDRRMSVDTIDESVDMSEAHDEEIDTIDESTEQWQHISPDMQPLETDINSTEAIKEFSVPQTLECPSPRLEVVIINPEDETTELATNPQSPEAPLFEFQSVETVSESPVTCEPSSPIPQSTADCLLSTEHIDESPEPSQHNIQIHLPIETYIISLDEIDECSVPQIVPLDSADELPEPGDPTSVPDSPYITIVDATTEEPPEPHNQLVESVETSEKSSRSSSILASHKSRQFSVDSAHSTADHEIVNDLVSAAVAEIIGVSPVVCAKPLVSDRIRSPCRPMVNSNPLRASSGAVLAVLKPQASDSVVTVVQEREVSFWHQPSRVFGIFGVRQQWTCQTGIVRRTEDTEVQSPYQNRVLLHNGQLVYIECRAKQFEPTQTRECYLSAVYMNVYFVDQQTGEARMHIVDLDKILGLAASIRYTTVSSGLNTSVVVSWTERSAQRTRCGFCKYSLSSELDMLVEVNEYPFAEQTVLSLSGFEEDKLLILGENSVMLWNYRTGDMLLNLDIDQPLGVSLGGFIADERSNRYMFLIQLVPTEDQQAQRLELLAINLSDCFSIKVVQSHDIPVDFAELSTCCVTSANVITATFTSGHSLLMSLGNPQIIHLRQPDAALCSPSSSFRPEIDESPSIQSFVVHDQIVQVFEDRMSIRTIWDHFHGGA